MSSGRKWRAAIETTTHSTRIKWWWFIRRNGQTVNLSSTMTRWALWRARRTSPSLRLRRWWLRRTLWMLGKFWMNWMISRGDVRSVPRMVVIGLLSSKWKSGVGRRRRVGTIGWRNLNSPTQRRRRMSGRSRGLRCLQRMNTLE